VECRYRRGGVEAGQAEAQARRFKAFDLALDQRPLPSGPGERRFSIGPLEVPLTKIKARQVEGDPRFPRA
jgi:hypothetical protein